MDPSRAAELTALIQRIDDEAPIDQELLVQVDQALTHVSSGRADHNERLEFFGDAVLRLAATEYLDRYHPQLSVGSSSSLRAQLVSDRWLAELGERVGLEPLLNLGPKARGDTAARATIRADATEALIGALYLGTSNLKTLHRWLTPHWHQTSAEVQTTPHRFHGKTTLQEWSQGKGLGLPVYVTEQRSSAHGDSQRFRSRVQVGHQVQAEAMGRSRKEAEQNAAAAAVQKLIGSDAEGNTELQ